MNTPEPISLAETYERIDRIHRQLAHGCGDGGCRIRKPVGQHTNGGCRCAPKVFSEELLWLACELEKYGRRHFP